MAITKAPETLDTRLVAELAARLTRAGKLPPAAIPCARLSVDPMEAVRVAEDLTRVVSCFKATGCWSKFKVCATRLLEDYIAGVSIRPQILNGVMHEQRGLWFGGEFWSVHEVARVKRNGD